MLNWAQRLLTMVLAGLVAVMFAIQCDRLAKSRRVHVLPCFPSAAAQAELRARGWQQGDTPLELEDGARIAPWTDAAGTVMAHLLTLPERGLSCPLLAPSDILPARRAG